MKPTFLLLIANWALLAQIGVGLPANIRVSTLREAVIRAADIPGAAAILTAVDRATRLPPAAPERTPIRSQRQPSPVVTAA